MQSEIVSSSVRVSNSFLFFFLVCHSFLGKKIQLFVSTGCVYSEWFPHNSGEGPLKTGASRDNCYIRKGSYYIPNVKNHDSAAEFTSQFPLLEK